MCVDMENIIHDDVRVAMLPLIRRVILSYSVIFIWFVTFVCVTFSWYCVFRHFHFILSFLPKCVSTLWNVPFSFHSFCINLKLQFQFKSFDKIFRFPLQPPQAIEPQTDRQTTLERHCWVGPPLPLVPGMEPQPSSPPWTPDCSCGLNMHPRQWSRPLVGDWCVAQTQVVFFPSLVWFFPWVGGGPDVVCFRQF